MRLTKITLILFSLTFSALSVGSQIPFALIDKQQFDLKNTDMSDLKRWIKESQLLYWRARYTDNLDRKKEMLKEALAVAKKARAAQPADPEALFYWICAQGELLTLKNPLAALSGLKPLEDEALKLKMLSPQFQFGAADRVLGRLYQMAPTFISIGSKTKARESFLNALRESPEFPANKIYYADFLLAQGDRKEARRLALEVLDSPWLSRYPMERFDWTRMAKNILDGSREATR